MGFEEGRINNRKADNRCAEPRWRLDAGEDGLEEVDAQREQLLVRDEEGHRCFEVAGPANASTSMRTAGSGTWHRITIGHRWTAFWFTGCSLSRPSRFPRGAKHGMSARPYRYPSRINRRLRTRFQIASQAAMERRWRTLGGSGAGRRRAQSALRDGKAR